MDIGHNLFYNENTTVHGGNFLANLTGFGKETMRKMIKVNTIVLLLSVLLCGCTRREQLVLEDISTGQEQQLTEPELTSQQVESVQQALEEQGVSDEEMSVRHEEPRTIYVHVCGAVVCPDVYELPKGCRVYEAVQAAGGFAEDADTSYVNQAQKLTDGVKLVIPTLEQTQALASEGEEKTKVGIVGETEGFGDTGVSDSVQGGASGDGRSDTSDGKININTASEAELCNIPGIGAVRAAAIVAYRQEKGSFSSIEDIMNVNGIKEGTYEKIKDSIKVN